jgi:phosphoribosylglycinamide formyltransferase-1
MIHIAIFASGSGSNAEQLALYFKNNQQITISCVLSNRKHAGVFDRLSPYNLNTYYVPKDDWQKEGVVSNILEKEKVDFIVLAGFLLKIPSYLTSIFTDKIFNIHPALLPKFGGKGMYGSHVHEAVKQAKESKTGITIHLVNEEFDKGKILFQASCDVHENDDMNTIAKNVQALEHAHFGEVIAQQILGNTSWEK